MKDCSGRRESFTGQEIGSEKVTWTCINTIIIEPGEWSIIGACNVRVIHQEKHLRESASSHPRT